MQEITDLLLKEFRLMRADATNSGIGYVSVTITISAFKTSELEPGDVKYRTYISDSGTDSKSENVESYDLHRSYHEAARRFTWNRTEKMKVISPPEAPTPKTTPEGKTIIETPPPKDDTDDEFPF